MSKMAGFQVTQFYKAPYRPVSSIKTTYAGMNSWRDGSERDYIPSHIPLTVTDANWRDIQVASSQPRPLPEKYRTDEFYRRYQNLSQNIAYRYPDPGPPRTRQGRIGGTWRHIKEVLGHGGSRVVFVDGLVSLYDGDRRKTSKQIPAVSRSTPHYSLNRFDVPSYQLEMQREAEMRSYNPWHNPGLNPPNAESVRGLPAIHTKEPYRREATMY